MLLYTSLFYDRLNDSFTMSYENKIEKSHIRKSRGNCIYRDSLMSLMLVRQAMTSLQD